jgi:hypothetical protein
MAATLAMATGACQQPTGQQLNATNTNSQVYIGALTCNVSGGTGYVFGSTKDLSCVYLTKDGLSQAYDGKIRRFGIDVVAANSSAGGNWLYGGSNNQIVLQATQIQDSRNAGYNLAYGIAEMSLSIGN